uniref:Uncharacterized protein n=1 Tax=Rhizophora mucronata TaxID=61149 RepID=A0A2P2L7W6_RHIMU
MEGKPTQCLCLSCSKIFDALR